MTTERRDIGISPYHSAISAATTAIQNAPRCKRAEVSVAHVFEACPECLRNAMMAALTTLVDYPHQPIIRVVLGEAASRPSPAERDRGDAVDLACLTLNAAYRCLVFRERQSNFHPTESLGAIAAYLQACLRGGDSLEAAEARYCHPKMHDAASRVSGASDA